VLNNLDGAIMVRFCILGFKWSTAASLWAVFLIFWYRAAGRGDKDDVFTEFNLTEKFGSIGRAMGNKVRIESTDEEGRGEIELKGRNVMLGYLNNIDKTKSAISNDGWLLTGDMGKFDEDQFVWLTGRLKEIMKDKGGEMIAPVAVEEGIKKACNKPGKSIVKQAITVGDGKYYISMLLTLVEGDVEGIPNGLLAGAAKAVDPEAKTIADAKKSSLWATELKTCIEEYNKVAAKSQQRIYRYAILPEDITAEHSPDLMTPTFKIKRTGVNDKYKDLIATCGGDAPLDGRVVKNCEA